MKYYVFRYRDGFQFKRTKCNDYWCGDHTKCWQYSRQGALGILKRLKENSNGFYEYGIIETDKADQIIAEYDKSKDLETFISECMYEKPWWT